MNIDAVGLRHSSHIANIKKKLLDPTLNHIGFVHANEASEEGMDPMKETLSFKEVMKRICRMNSLKPQRRKCLTMLSVSARHIVTRIKFLFSEILQST